MRRAPKACSHPDCAETQPCPDHQRKPWEGSTRRPRLPSDWNRRRTYILNRDPTCKDGRICKGLALSTEVDHVVPGDDHSFRNLQGICGECHTAKTNEEAAQSRAAKR